MTISFIDPLSDPRWRDFVRHNNNATVFHAPEWLTALKQTYNYVPVVIGKNDQKGCLVSGLLFCRVDSWLTGRRFVSLPFSDHCQPLAASPEDMSMLINEAQNSMQKGCQKYLELRPIDFNTSTSNNLSCTESFYFHYIDLTRSIEEIRDGFHTTAVKQMIKRADREKLSYLEGRTNRHLDMFYRLLLITRQRHQIPPQPKRWFRNLLACLGDYAKIRIALKDNEPIASILTLSYKQSHYYKYGCSDLRFSKLGGTQMLLWRAIQDAKENGADLFDMGRSEPSNKGLVDFKERWGAQRRDIFYYRYYRHPSKAKITDANSLKIAKAIFQHIPCRLQETIGNIVYKHIG